MSRVFYIALEKMAAYRPDDYDDFIDLDDDGVPDYLNPHLDENLRTEAYLAKHRARAAREYVSGRGRRGMKRGAIMGGLAGLGTGALVGRPGVGLTAGAALGGLAGSVFGSASQRADNAAIDNARQFMQLTPEQQRAEYAKTFARARARGDRYERNLRAAHAQAAMQSASAAREQALAARGALALNIYDRIHERAAQRGTR